MIDVTYLGHLYTQNLGGAKTVPPPVVLALLCTAKSGGQSKTNRLKVDHKGEDIYDDQGDEDEHEGDIKCVDDDEEVDEEMDKADDDVEDERED